MKKLLLLTSLVLLILFECIRVYLIMPMPGSQQFNSIELAYFLGVNKWAIRLIAYAWVIILGLFVFIILSYGIYVGVSSVKNNLYSGIGSLIIIVITGFAIQFTTMISLMLYILNQIKQREFRSNWKNWIDKNE